MPTQDPVRTLLVSLSAIWVCSVRAVVETLPAVQVEAVAHGGLGAYQHVRDHKPALVIVDDTLPLDEVARLLALLTELPARPYCIVVVTTSREAPHAMVAGADAAVPRAQVSHRLLAAVASAVQQVGSQSAAA